MWAVIAIVFVYYSYDQSHAAAVLRMAATSVSLILCLAYLAILPFHPWGLAALIGLVNLATILTGRPDDVVTTAVQPWSS
jgi:TRAP-type C4-dicarboxylate transport system permease small subunit